MTTSPTAPTFIEVEKKFAITLYDLTDEKQNISSSNDAITRMEDRLRKLGLESKGSFTLVDWYFDVEEPQENQQKPKQQQRQQNDDSCYSSSSSWPLTTRDCWLRYRQVIRYQDKNKNRNHNDDNNDDSLGREVISGKWQLKIGKSKSSSTENCSIHSASDAAAMSARTTVYEEIEGDEAIEIARALLVQHGYQNQPIGEETNSNETNHLWQGSALPSGAQRVVPHLPDPSFGLVPFARIESNRSSWVVPSENPMSSSLYKGLAVDLDVTPFGYAVGEVEAIVHDELEVGQARDRIQQFLNLLLDGEDNFQNTTVGKLEYYLMKYKPKHYQACIANGSLPSSNSTSAKNPS